MSRKAKDVAAKKRKRVRRKAEKAASSAQFKEEENTFQDFRQKAPYIKLILKDRGHDFHFYDYLDSYQEAFQSIARNAVMERSSLLGVHELSDNEEDGDFWRDLGYDDLTQIFFSTDEGLPDYGTEHGKGRVNLEGAMTAFQGGDGALHSLISIRKNIKTSMRHPELKYACKIAALLHEIGHVIDLEVGKNIDVQHKTMDVIEAEVYANLYALDQMANLHFFQSFRLLRDGIRDSIKKGGYMAQVGELVFERLPEYNLTDWQPLFFGSELTGKELKLIGPLGQRILTG